MNRFCARIDRRLSVELESDTAGRLLLLIQQQTNTSIKTVCVALQCSLQALRLAYFLRKNRHTMQLEVIGRFSKTMGEH